MSWLAITIIWTPLITAQFASHHTSYGSPFAVPSHGSSTFLSPIGANSLSSVLSALGIAPSTAPGTAGPPRSSHRAPEVFFKSSSSGGNPTRRQSPSPPPADPLLRNIGRIGATTSNAISDRFQPPPSATGRNQPLQGVSLDQQSVNLLSNLVTDLLNPSVASPFSGLSGQTPFIVVLPETGVGGGQGSPSVIMNMDPALASQNTAGQTATANNLISNVASLLRANGFPTDLQSPTGTGAAATPTIINLPTQRANAAGTPALSSLPNETPVLLVLDPSTIQNTRTTGTRGGSATNRAGINNRNFLDVLTALAQSVPSLPNRANRAGAVNAAAATSNLPPFPGQGNLAAGSTAGTAPANTIPVAPNGPPPPATSSVPVVVNGIPVAPNGAGATAGPVNGAGATAGTAAAPPAFVNGAGATAAANGGAATAVNGAGAAAAVNGVGAAAAAPNAAAVGTTATGTAAAAADLVGGPSFQSEVPATAAIPGGAPAAAAPKKMMQMIIPVVSPGSNGGIYMYSFTIATPDGVTRHETGEVAPGLRRISRIHSPAAGTGAAAPAANGAAAAATPAANGAAAPAANGAAAPAANGAAAPAVNGVAGATNGATAGPSSLAGDYS